MNSLFIDLSFSSILKELIQYGMSMIDPEQLLKKLTSIPNAEKPRRPTQKGLYSQVPRGKILYSAHFPG